MDSGTRRLVESIEKDDVDVLTAAILHDTVEDTPCTLDEIRQRFGPRVATLVDWVTNPPLKEGEDRAEVRRAYLSRPREAPTDALVIKLADRLSNVQRLDTHPSPKKQRSYYDETARWIVPLAQLHPWFHEWYDEWQQRYQHLAIR